MSDLSNLQTALGTTFTNSKILLHALTHSSYLNENPDRGEGDNQRMEFLGDAILNMCVAEALYLEFPDFPEGRLTETRVSMIRQEKLAEKAAALNLGQYLRMGKGEEASGGREKRNNLADTFEALIAAIFLDRGPQAAREFVARQFCHEMDDIKSGKLSQNYKAALQEYAQAQFKALPEYEIIESSGPDHDKIFVVSVSLEDVVLAIGSGKTRKLAEAEAARSAFVKLTDNDSR